MENIIVFKLYLVNNLKGSCFQLIKKTKFRQYLPTSMYLNRQN